MIKISARSLELPIEEYYQVKELSLPTAGYFIFARLADRDNIQYAIRSARLLIDPDIRNIDLPRKAISHVFYVKGQGKNTISINSSTVELLGEIYTIIELDTRYLPDLKNLAYCNNIKLV